MRRIDLRDKVVIVTGASQGIGAETAQAFAQAGARVVLAARAQSALGRLAAAWGQGRALAVPTDIADAASVERMIAQTLAAFGRVDILINNAGVGYLSPLLKTRPDKIEDLILYFDNQEVVAALGQVTDGQCLVLRLSGYLLDGTPIVGEDVVLIHKK